MSTTHREGRWRGWRPRARHGGAKRRSAEGVGSGKGRRSPSPVWGSEGIAPENFEFNCANLFIFKRQGLKYLKMSTHSSKVNCTLDKVNSSTAHFVSENFSDTKCAVDFVKSEKTHNFRPCITRQELSYRKQIARYTHTIRRGHL